MRPLAILAVRSGLLGLLTQARVQANAVACQVCEESEPAGIRDLGLGYECLAAKRFSFGKGGVDIVGRDVNEYFARLVRGVFTYFDEAAAGARLCLEHVVVECLVDLNVPTEEVCIELSCRCGILRRNF